MIYFSASYLSKILNIYNLKNICWPLLLWILNILSYKFKLRIFIFKSMLEPALKTNEFVTLDIEQWNVR